MLSIYPHVIDPRQGMHTLNLPMDAVPLFLQVESRETALIYVIQDHDKPPLPRLFCVVETRQPIEHVLHTLRYVGSATSGPDVPMLHLFELV